MAKKIKLALKEEVYELEGEDGVIRTYKVRELTGPQLAIYMESRIKNFVNGTDGTKGVKSYSGIFTNLLKLCLYDEEGKPVPLDVINKWPASLHQQMFADGIRLSGLADEVNAEANGEANPTPAT